MESRTNRQTNPEKRSYPASCISMYCGKSGNDCNSSCKFWSKLQEFEAWVELSNAKVLDEVWSQNVYVAPF